MSIVSMLYLNRILFFLFVILFQSEYNEKNCNRKKSNDNICGVCDG